MTTLLGMVVGAMLVGLGILVRLTRAQLGEAASALRPDEGLAD